VKQDYYWATSKQFPARNRELLSVGRWGKLFRAEPVNYAKPFHYIQELVYENVRLQSYPAQISRLEAFFFFDCLDWAIDYAGDNILYEVELLDPTAQIDRHIITDFGAHLYKKNAEGLPEAAIAEIEQNAHRYWDYSPRPRAVVELATKSPVKVVRKARWKSRPGKASSIWE
jgi:hypothetical protein